VIRGRGWFVRVADGGRWCLPEKEESAMPIVMTMQWDGVTAEQYDRVRKEVNWEGNAPAGGMFHVASFAPEGLRVTDLWESAESFNRFVEQRLMPGVQKLGIPGQPRVEIRAVHALFTPAYRAV
jgi:hypothetical protein